MMKTKGSKLTIKQKNFVAEYQKDWNATRAAIQVGYKPHRAAEVACRLIKKSQVQEAIEKEVAERLRKIGVHAERVLSEVARVALSDIRKIYREDGTLKLPSEWGDDEAATIAGVEVFEEFAGRGEDRALIGYTKKVKRFDKVKATELLMKYLGLLGNGKHHDDEDKEGVDRVLTTLELSAKIIYLVKIAANRSDQKKVEESKSAGQPEE